MLMWATPVVVIHQVIADIPFCILKTHVSRCRDPLRFQASEQPLHWGIIPAVTPSTHALGDPVAPQPLSELTTGVLATLVTVKQDIAGTASLLICHVQGLNSQVGIRLI